MRLSLILAAASLAVAQTAPEQPPRAGRIQISEPDDRFNAVITGTAGAVPPRSVLFLSTMATGHFAVTTAAGDGSFRATSFVPPGYAVLIKAAPPDYKPNFDLAQSLRVRGASFGHYPATIIHAPMPAAAGEGIPVALAGFAAPNGEPPEWRFRGTMNANRFSPGQTVRLRGAAWVDSPVLERIETLRSPQAVLGIERLNGPDGAESFAMASFVSEFLTPTQFPIERGSSTFGAASVPLPIAKTSPTRFDATVDLAFELPGDLLPGYYRLHLGLNFPGVPAAALTQPVSIIFDPRRLTTFLNGDSVAFLPVIQVGEPAAPRMFWTLLTDNLSSGSRGTEAIEDRDSVRFAARVVTQSDKCILPRLDASGRPARYRLEPFLVGLSAGERLQHANPPRVAFRFPSGSLRVRIDKPDGTSETIGPAPFVQSRMSGVSDGFGRVDGVGFVSDVYQLTTLDPRFEVEFQKEGRYVIRLDGEIDAVDGTRFTGRGTYEIHVARTLSLDTTVLPGTPFEIGDVFHPGMTVSPPVPAKIEVHYRLAPNSDASRMIERRVSGQANRFGYFHPGGEPIHLDQPGEYRVDMTATHTDAQGNIWIGARTWGGVIAPRDTPIIARGRRGVDQSNDPRPQWFFRLDTGRPAFDGSHVQFAFHSGDVMWLERSDSVIPLMSFQDPGRTIAGLLRSRAPMGRIDEQRLAMGELPLVTSRRDNLEPQLDPSKIDLFAYWYASVQKPLVRIREGILDDSGVGAPYWRFGDHYARQIGAGIVGDLPNDFKFQYGAVVLRGPAIGDPLYAIYGSLFVLVPENDIFGGSRVFPPFQGNGGGPGGGPVMQLQGKDIEMFMHLTGVRPGSVLEAGDRFALAGAVGPPLAATVSYVVTTPSGKRIALGGKANRVGYYYRPEDDFAVDEPGIYTVDLRVMYDGLISSGQLTEPFPTGDVLGSVNGRFYVYVVSPASRLLAVSSATGLLDVTVDAPGLRSAHATTMMPGFVLQSGDLPVASGRFTYRFNPFTLSRDFPNLDTFPVVADLITITLYGVTAGADGQPTPAARIITLHRSEILSAASLN